MKVNDTNRSRVSSSSGVKCGTIRPEWPGHVTPGSRSEDAEEETETSGRRQRHESGTGRVFNQAGRVSNRSQIRKGRFADGSAQELESRQDQQVGTPRLTCVSGDGGHFRWCGRLHGQPGSACAELAAAGHRLSIRTGVMAS